MIWNKKINNHKAGFTIVELLVVIVVVGILAAITVVAYTNVTNKARTSQSQTAASAVIRKVNIYTADANAATTFPTTLAALTGAVGTSYYVNGITSYGTSAMAQPANPNVVQYQICGYKTVTGTATATTVYAEIAAAPGSSGGVITGVKINYWKYDGTPQANSLTIGTTSGSTPVAINCASSAT
jgi:prepilin-type N-terminal cleavage/methylation domain-containing protein